MSVDLTDDKPFRDDALGSMRVTSFWGGKSRGACLQFTLSSGQYIQLDKKEVARLLSMLLTWLLA